MSALNRHSAALEIARAFRDNGLSEEYVTESLAIVTGDRGFAEAVAFIAFQVEGNGS